MTSDLPVLRVDDIEPYLPLRVTSSLPRVWSDQPDTYVLEPPERVWVPVNDDPPAPGDRVALTEPCPEARPGAIHVVEARNVDWAVCSTCEGTNEVVRAEATVAETLPVHDLDFAPVPDHPHLTHTRGVALGVFDDDTDDVGRYIGDLPGDWSSARFGVRVTDVEATGERNQP